MTSRYSPQVSRHLAERAITRLPPRVRELARIREVRRYHDPERMLALAGEVEALRALLLQARRLRYAPDVGYVDVRHLVMALKEFDEAPIAPHLQIAPPASR